MELSEKVARDLVWLDMVLERLKIKLGKVVAK
jgi:hypothetical protein